MVHGVTGIAEMTAAHGWRIPWAAKMCAETAEELLAPTFGEVQLIKLVRKIKGAPYRRSGDAIDIGNAVHKWCERWVLFQLGKGAEPNEPNEKIVLDAVRPFVDWCKVHKPTFLASEDVCYYKDEYDFAGTMDLRFLINGKTCIGDFKTAKSLKREYIFQIGLYALAIEQTFGEKVHYLYLFRLPKIEGDSFEVKHFPFTDKLRKACESLNQLKHMAVDVDLWLKNGGA